MTVGNYNLNQIWLQFGKYQHQFRMVVAILLGVYLIAFAAELTWKLFPGPGNEGVPQRQALTAGTQGQSEKGQINLAQIKRLNLFGDLAAVEKAPEPQVTEAPETNLNLTLSGVVASSDPKVGAAIVENRGKQNTYGINEKIDGTNAILKEVYEDKVIIKNGNRHETLMLDGVDFNAGNASRNRNASARQASASRAINKRPPQMQKEQRKVLTQDVAKTTRELQKAPTGFTDYIAISPYRQEGQLRGYRISPGKKPKLFRAAGFKAGDVVVEINGLDLTDPQQSLEAMQALRNAQSLQLTVNRGDNTLTLYLDFPEAGMEL